MSSPFLLLQITAEKSVYLAKLLNFTTNELQSVSIDVNEIIAVVYQPIALFFIMLLL